MKKITPLILTGLIIFTFQLKTTAQGSWSVKQAPYFIPQSLAAPSVLQKSTVAGTIQDTLWYFYNKHLYRNPLTTPFFYFNSPNSQVTFPVPLGSLFINTGTLTVTGLEAICGKSPASASASLAVKLYLCKVNAGNLPLLPPLDSVTAYCTSAQDLIGADFTTPRTMTANFAVLMKNASPVTTDTLFAYLNNALAPNSTSGSAFQKYGEGLGIARLPGGLFIKMTNLLGAGTDYEFLVAPRVTFNSQLSVSSPTGNACLDSVYDFTKTSSPSLDNRQFNFNAFYRYLKPFGNTSAITSSQPDSIFTWNFGDASGTEYSHTTTLTHSYTVQGVYNGTLTGNYKRMHRYQATSPLTVPFAIADSYQFQVKAVNCNTVNSVGILAHSIQPAAHIYPNPTEGGVTKISGLTGINSVFIYNAFGQLVSQQRINQETLELDFKTIPAGNYFIRIKNQDDTNNTFFKLIHTN